jgi:hypothetical protein
MFFKINYLIVLIFGDHENTCFIDYLCRKVGHILGVVFVRLGQGFESDKVERAELHIESIMSTADDNVSLEDQVEGGSGYSSHVKDRVKKRFKVFKALNWTRGNVFIKLDVFKFLLRDIFRIIV